MDKNDCNSREDNELTKMAINDSQYFYCLMKRYEVKLIAYVKRLTYLNDEDIPDIVQESFIKAYQHLNDCDCSLKFSSWLYRIVHNQAVNYLKKHHKNIRVLIDEENDEFVEWLSDGTDIEKDMITMWHKDQIMLLLDKLKPEYKEVLILKFFEEKEYQEISDILEKPMGTVATLISRAKKQFKEEYEKAKQYQ